MNADLVSTSPLAQYRYLRLLPLASLLAALGTAVPARALDDIPAGQTYLIQGSGAVGHLRVLSGGFKVLGTLRLESKDGGYVSALTVTNGFLTNTLSGLIEVNPGSGGPRAVTGNVLNYGTFNANYGLDLSLAGGLFQNLGKLNVAPGVTVSLAGADQVFRQDGGSLVINGAMNFSGSRFNFNGGAISGTPFLINSTLAIGSGALDPASFTLTGSGSEVQGDVWPGQTVWVQGDGTGGHTTVTAPQGFANRGTLRLESRDGGYVSSLTVEAGGLTNGASGLIVIAGGAGGPRILSSHLLNQGDFEANYALTLSKAKGVYENEGTFHVSGGVTVAITGQEQIFNQNGGTLAVDGALILNGIDFNYRGGQVTGTPFLINSDLTIASQATAPATFLQTGSGSVFHGDLWPGQTLWVQGNGSGGHTTLSAPQGFANRGTLRLESRDGGYVSSLTVDAGRLTNSVSGLIVIGSGAGGPRTLSTDLLNQGDFEVNYPLSLSKAKGTYDNEGTFHISAGITLAITGQEQTFNQNGGTLAVDGGLTLNGIDFNYRGGTIKGTPYLVNSELTIAPRATAPVSFLLTGSGSVLHGDPGPGHTLWVQGNGFGGHTTLVAPTGFTNAGTLRLESRDGGYASSLTVGEGTLVNAGTGVVEINGGAGGPRTLTADLLNQGVIRARWGLSFVKDGGRYVNASLFDIAEGVTVSIVGRGQRFDQSAGLLAVAGAMSLNDIDFNYLGGVITGTPYLINSRLTIGAEATNAASFLQTGSGSVLTGDIWPGQNVWIQGNGLAGHTTLGAPQGFQNRGHLRFESRDGGYSSSLALDGVLTNATDGILDFNSGAGGSRVLAADLLNRGTLNANWHLTLDRNGGVYRNEGVLNVASNMVLSMVGRGQRFEQNSGTLAIDGAMNLNGITFGFNGGTVEGSVSLINSTLLLGPGATSAASFVQTGSGSVLRGDLQTGQNLWVQGNGSGGHTTLTAPAGFSNAGRLRFESRNGGYTSALAVGDGILTNAETGVIEFNGGAGGARSITGDVVNRGAFNVNYSGRLDKAGGIFVNEGIVAVAAGQTLTVAGAYSQLAGTTLLNGGTLTSGSPVALQGGSLRGEGTVGASLVSGAEVAPGAAVGVLRVTGDYTQGPAGTLEIELGGLAPGQDYDQLLVAGSAQLAGKLRVVLRAGFQPAISNSFTLLQAKSVAGGFAGWELPPLPSSQRWELVASGGTVTLSVAAQGAAPQRISGLVKDIRGTPLANASVFAALPSYNGLRAEYYTNADLTGLKLVRLDSAVNFDWGGGAPSPDLGADSFSARWTAKLEPRFSETYSFYTVSDDGVRLWINGQALVNNWTVHGATENSGQITLVAGQKYDVVMEYFENTGGAVARLSWSSPSQAKEVIPASRLTPPSLEGMSPDPSAIAVISTLTDATGRYQLEVFNGLWVVGVSGLASLGYDDAPNQQAQVANNNPTLNFEVSPFSGQYFQVATSSNPTDAGATAGAGSYPASATVTVTATADTSLLPWQFRNWTESGLAQSESNPYAFTLTRDRRLVANFVLPTYQVTASNDPPTVGVVSGTGVYTHGATARLRASAGAGYRFVNWTEAGQVIGADDLLTLVVLGPHAVTAHYTEANLNHRVVTATLPSGLATVAGAGTYTNGQAASFSAPPAVTNGPSIFLFKRFTLQGAVLGTDPLFQKTFSTLDATDLLFVAEYDVRSLAPLIIRAQPSRDNPMPAITDFNLVLQFDRSMAAAPEPLVVLTNARAAVQPVVPAGGAWSATAVANDTYTTPSIVLAREAEGTNLVFVSQAQDTGGQALLRTNVLAVVVDATPPGVNQVSAVPGLTSAQVTGRTDEPASVRVEFGLTAIYGSLTLPADTLTVEHRIELAGLTPNTTYHFRLRARDHAGNERVTPDSVFTTLKDVTSPQTAFVDGPASDQTVCALPVTFQWQAADDATPAPMIAFAWSLDGAAWTAFAATNAVTLSALAEGAHRFEVKARDLAGNEETPPASRRFSVDFSAPKVGSIKANPAPTTAAIVWGTDRPATAQVDYGPTAAYGSASPLDARLTTNHVVNLGGLTPGTPYHFRVRSANPCAQETLSLDGVFTTPPAPDLAVTNLELLPAAGLVSGSALTVRWKDANVGLGAAQASWLDRVVATNLDTGRELVDTLVPYDPTVEGALTNGATRARTYTFKLPDGPAGVGSLAVTVTVDARDTVFEYNADGSAETNNSAAQTIGSTLARYPDLAVTAISFPSSAQAGQSIELRWSITNQGPGQATGPWADALALSASKSGAPAQALGTFTYQGNLASGGILTRTQTVILPPGLYGDRYFVVTTDSAQEQFETNETNNARVSDQPLRLVGADLAVEAITVPANVLFGQPISVGWTVRNLGAAPATANWSDRLFLSPTPSLLGARPLLTQAVTEASPLAPGAAYTRSATVVLPLEATLPNGRYFLLVLTDFAGQQPEANDGNNLGVSGATVATLPALPDLTVLGFTAPEIAVPGQMVDLSWTTTNRGHAAVSEPWTETVWLTQDLAPGQGQPVATFAVTNLLAPGQTLTQTQRVTLPSSVAVGGVRFQLETDSGYQILEEVETNNLAAATNLTQIPAALTLELPVSRVNENTAGVMIPAVVSRSGGLSRAVTVALTNSDPSHLAVPAAVIIPAGKNSAQFDITPVADGLVTGPSEVRIIASAEGFAPDTASITVLDSDVHRLSLRLASATVREGQTLAATVSRDTVTDQALLVEITTTDPAQLLPSVPVTIPANQASADFLLLANDDARITATQVLGVTVSALGYADATASVQVLDNDGPTLRLELLAPAISESGANQMTTATLTRDPASNRPLTVELEANDPNLVWVPSRVTIPATKAATTFPILAVDNTLVDGTRRATIRVFLLDGITGARLAEGAAAQLDVLDDDGPTLRLALERSVVGEGLNPATTGTVSRNTATSLPLTVNLSSSDNTEATVPATVVIPAGSSSAVVPVSTVQDGSVDGNQSVTLSATASGFSPGSATLVVTDSDLPDLLITTVSAPANGETDGLSNCSFRLVNQGLATASGTTVQRVYLSSDPFLSGDDILAGQFPFTGDLPVDQHIDQTLSFYLPNQPGDYWAIVVADAEQGITETLENNNTTVSTAPIRVAPAYVATVVADVHTATAGTAIPLHGQAQKAGGGPAPFALVSIHVKVRNTERVLAALAGDDGRFTATFQPLPGEAGRYTIGAAHPAVSQAPTQDQFTLLGMKADPSRVDQAVSALSSVSGQVNLENLSDIPLTGLTVKAIGVSDLDVQVQLTNALPGVGSIPVRYNLQSLTNEGAVVTFTLRITSNEGASLDLPMSVLIQPREPHLRVEPSTIALGVVRGQQTLTTLEVVNVGGAASGPLQVILPDVPWMRVVSTNSLPPLAPGETNTITLRLAPPAELPIGEYTGQLGISGETVGVNIPFKFKNVSSAVGDLKLTTVDERAYYGENPTNLVGASVTLRDPFNNQVVASGQSDARGEFFVPGLHEGTYNLEITAPKHDTTSGTIDLKPGALTEKIVFLRTRLVSYKWTVEEIEIEDRTKIVLETVFETTVPTPVVTIEPSLIDLAQVQGNEAQIDLTISNHGLIAANHVQLNFDSHPLWTITPLIREVGVLPAKSSLTIPLLVQRVKPPQAGAVALASAGNGAQVAPASGPSGIPCTFSGGIVWTLVCGPLDIAYPVPIPVINAYGDCLPKPGRARIEIPPWPWRIEVPVIQVPRGSGGRDGTSRSYNHTIHTRYESTPPTYGEAKNCSCEKGNFTTECVKGEAGLKLELGEAVKKALNLALPPYIQTEGVKVKFSGSGQICTCCENGIKSIKAKADAGAEIEAKAVLGFQPKAKGQTEVPGLGMAEYEAQFLAGAEVTLYGNVKGTLSTDCNLANPKICLSGRVGIKAAPQLRGSVKLTATGPNGEKYGGGGKAMAGVEVGAYVTLEGCNDGKGLKAQGCTDDVVFKAEIEGSLKSGAKEYYAKASYTATLAKGGCYPKAGVDAFVPLPDDAFGVTLSAAGVAKWFGYDSAQDLARAASGTSAVTLGAHASASELAQTILAGQALVAGPSARHVSYEWRSPVPASAYAESPAARTAKAAAPAGPQSGVCAQVRLQIEQSAVLTRKAVGATLEIANDSENPLEELTVTLSIYDPQGELANDKFVVLAPELTRIEPVGGGAAGATNDFSVTRDLWRLAANATGRARWVILPKDDAAPVEPLVYRVGGVFTYTSGGVPTAAPLVPGPVTVYPNAKLKLKYFHQRDVISDDPFTEEIEPAEPFTLAVMAHNIGRGLAKNFSIASAQPKIVDNQKGLLIDFDIIATEVAGRSLSPSLTADFGNLGPGDIKIGRWLLKSSLLGFFLDYTATFEHEDSLGGRATSLIDSVEIHELIHLVRAPGPLDDGKPDFLVNDTRDDENLPDTIYLSDDTTAPVAALTVGTPDRAPSAENLTVALSSPLPAGWAYLRIPDPADGQFRLKRVVRSDGLEIPVGTNVWVSHYTFTRAGERPTKENRLHLLDHDSTGAYTLTYEPLPAVDKTPPTSAVTTLAAESAALFPVRWAGQDAGGSGLAHYDILVSVNGGPYVPWLQRTLLEGAIYKGELGKRYAFYSMATDGAGNQEPSHATPDAQTTVSLSNRAPVLAPISEQVLEEGDTLQLVVSATDPDGALNTLAYSVEPGAPLGVSLDGASGQLSWATARGQGGTTNRVTVRVTDNGVPPLSDTETFTVVIRKRNTAPILAAIPTQNAAPGQLLSFQVSATDSDVPANTLRFSLEPGAPAGARIDAATGQFTWTPGTNQPLGVYPVAVRVTDNGVPVLSATATFNIRVDLLNHAPVLGKITDRFLPYGRTLIITNTAQDLDQPAQSLVFSLEPGSPAGAFLDPVSGVFAWHPDLSQAATSQVVTIKVTDNGQPPASGTQSFTVVVGHYLELDLGSAVTLAGGSGSLPLYLYASAGLTNADFALGFPAGRLTNLVLQVLSPRLTNSVLSGPATRPLVSLRTTPGSAFLETAPVARLNFTAAMGNATTLTSLEINDLVGRAQTYAYTNLFVRDGRVAILGEEPLLGAQMLPSGTLRLTLYGKPGITCQIQTAPRLGAGAPWSWWEQVTLTNEFQVFDAQPASQRQLFFRALRLQGP